MMKKVSKPTTLIARVVIVRSIVTIKKKPVKLNKKSDEIEV
ncbi:hypothetical protein [Budvicia aquatica]|nr:hypothetical protein [Budvicia aquatica]GKX49923.1 hypothetical protein SOASR029_02320 [Budvicia aquatica]